MIKNLFISTAFLFVALLFTNATSKIPAPITNANIFSKQKTFTRADVEKQIGRKFTFKERVGWWLIKNKINNPEPIERKKMSDKTKYLILSGVATLIGILTVGAIGLLVSVIGFIVLNIFDKNRTEEPHDLEYRHQNNNKANVKYLEAEPKKVVIATTKEEEEMLDRKIKERKKEKTDDVVKKVLITTGIIIVTAIIAIVAVGYVFSIFLKVLLGIQ